jgi:hypothetical protein
MKITVRLHGFLADTAHSKFHDVSDCIEKLPYEVNSSSAGQKYDFFLPEGLLPC